MKQAFSLFILLLTLMLLNQTFANDNIHLAKSDFISPVNTNAIYVLGTGTIATLIIMFDKHNLDKQAKNQAEFNPPFKKYGYIGEVIGWGYLNGLYILGQGTYGYLKHNRQSKERAEIMASSSFMTLLSTSLLKLSINRQRPSFPDRNDSFPSGHASMSFNFASVITAEHGIWWGIPAHLIAAAISYSRVNDGWHWVSDLVAGATIGISYGWGVYLNRRKQKQRYWFSAYPTNDMKGGIFKVSYFF